MIKTVLGEIENGSTGITLVHEHICCYNESVYQMAGREYLDKEELLRASVSYLKQMKEQYGLTTFVDCTPVNIGRDVDLLRNVAEQAEINLICSTGFYYSEEPVLYNTSSDQLYRYLVTDARTVNAGIIKCAVESETIGAYLETVLRACAKAHLDTGLPIVMHTNARNQNGLKALEILLSEGVSAKAVTVSHLSDTEDLEYVKEIADFGCFIGLDRLHGNVTEDYVAQKVQSVRELWNAGYGDQILLSHDSLFFSGFDREPKVNRQPRLAYCFDHILPELTGEMAERIMIQNPARMLNCGYCSLDVMK